MNSGGHIDGECDTYDSDDGDSDDVDDGFSDASDSVGCHDHDECGWADAIGGMTTLVLATAVSGGRAEDGTEHDSVAGDVDVCVAVEMVMTPTIMDTRVPLMPISIAVAMAPAR